jgi:hypothetical protein
MSAQIPDKKTKFATVRCAAAVRLIPERRIELGDGGENICSCLATPGDRGE